MKPAGLNVMRTRTSSSHVQRIPARQSLPCRGAPKSTVPHALPCSSVNTRVVNSNSSRLSVSTKAAQVSNEVQTLEQPNSIGYEDCIMFQAFGWESHTSGKWYKTVQEKVADFQAAGFTHVWLPPPSNSPVAPQGYMPGQLYNLSSRYGNEEELKELNSKLREAGILPLGDIVINHRCACAQSKDGTWNKFGDDQDHEGNKLDWDKWAITGNDPHFKGTGNPDTGEDYGPAPDLDHANPELREGLKHWMQYLHQGVGFSGWRFDYVKGYGAEFIDEYIQGSVGPNTVNVGEYWTDLKWNDADLDYNQDDARQRLCDWLDGSKKSAAAFDFPTKGILQEAVKKCQYDRLKDSQGKAPGLIGWWPKMAVTFIDNHDTGSTQSHWPFPNDHVGAGYAYIITHPGIPCIFWEHFFDWGEELQKTISTLIDVRKRNGIKSDSKLEIVCAEKDLYVACIDDKVLLKLGPRYEMGELTPDKAEWKKAVTGKDFAVWEKPQD